MLPRKQYLDKLIQKEDNRRVKVITGLHRCGKAGKSVVLFQLYNDLIRRGLDVGVAEYNTRGRMERV